MLFQKTVEINMDYFGFCKLNSLSTEFSSNVKESWLKNTYDNFMFWIQVKKLIIKKSKNKLEIY